MTKLLILNYEYPPLGGGAANANWFLLQELMLYPEIKVELVTSSTSGFRIEEQKNVKIHYLDINKSEELHKQSISDLLLYSFKAYLYVKKMLKTTDFDLIHSYFGIPCGYIAQKLDKPYIVSLRGSDVPFHTKKYYWLDRLFFARMSKQVVWKKAEFVVANSEGLALEVHNTAPEQLVELIPNGVDTHFFRPKSKNNSALEIISVSRVTIHKGYRYLLSALEGLQNYHLTIVGDGPDVHELEKIAKQKNINISFVGRLEKGGVLERLQQADVFVLPSLNEGMSNAVMEAMAVGLPVIMTNVGGASELIKQNGFVVKKQNTNELKEALITYQKDKILREKHALQSRKLAEEMSWANTAKEYVQLYDRVINKTLSATKTNK